MKDEDEKMTFQCDHCGAWCFESERDSDYPEFCFICGPFREDFEKELDDREEL